MTDSNIKDRAVPEATLQEEKWHITTVFVDKPKELKRESLRTANHHQIEVPALKTVVTSKAQASSLQFKVIHICDRG